jgi:hypothetical protein
MVAMTAFFEFHVFHRRVAEGIESTSSCRASSIARNQKLGTNILEVSFSLVVFGISAFD